MKKIHLATSACMAFASFSTIVHGDNNIVYPVSITQPTAKFTKIHFTRRYNNQNTRQYNNTHFICDNNNIIIDQQYLSSENKTIYYACARAMKNGELLHTSNHRWITEQKKTRLPYRCSGDKVLTGKLSYKNYYTKYRCSDLIHHGQTVSLHGKEQVMAQQEAIRHFSSPTKKNNTSATKQDKTLWYVKDMLPAKMVDENALFVLKNAHNNPIEYKFSLLDQEGKSTNYSGALAAGESFYSKPGEIKFPIPDEAVPITLTFIKDKITGDFLQHGCNIYYRSGQRQQDKVNISSQCKNISVQSIGKLSSIATVTAPFRQNKNLIKS